MTLLATIGRISLAITSLVLLTLTCLGFLSDQWWIAELAVNFRLQYFLGFLVLLIIFTMSRRPLWSGLTFVGCLINFYFLWSYFSPEPAKVSNGVPLSVTTFNVSMWSQRWQRVPDFFNDYDSDVVFLTEFSDNWGEYLKMLDSRYPYRIEKSARHPFGFALISRYPILHWEIEHLQPGNTPYLRATLSINGQAVQILGLHFYSPINKRAILLRNRQIAYFTEQIKQTTLPSVLLGDLNVSPFSGHYRRLVTMSPFSDKVTQWSINGTWPAVPLPFRIMIDHCLATPDFVIVRRREGDGFGSDHLPLSCELLLKDDSPDGDSTAE